MNRKPSFYYFLILDLVFITLSFLFFIWLKPASIRIYLPRFINPFIGFLITWLVVSFFGDKFTLYSKRDLISLLKPVLRIDISILALTSLLIYLFGAYHYSRLIVFGTILFASAAEILFIFFYFLHRKLRSSDEFSVSLFNPPSLIDTISKDLLKGEMDELDEGDVPEDPLLPHLRDIYLKEQTGLFQFLQDNLRLQRIDHAGSAVMDTGNIFNIKTLDTVSLHFYLNLHRLNNQRRVNKYFIEVNDKLENGGIFITCAETLALRYQKIFSNYPVIIAWLIAGLDGIFRRIFPKLPIFKEIYFALTRGRNRLVSRAEVMGRLYFCGFRVAAIREIDDLLFFIAVKKALPLQDIEPSYGPFIKMKRIGYNGVPLYIYKFRTMHPYSEYIQEYIFAQSELEETGKFKDDFRITGWGSFLRSVWLDELPQLINLFRGEISLVGVRAISEQYFNLYPKELKELRVKIKPGLVPPYYADLPGSFEEILESERNYLEQKLKKPIRTDWKYFWKAVYNIIFKGVRSS